MVHWRVALCCFKASAVDSNISRGSSSAAAWETECAADTDGDEGWAGGRRAEDAEAEAEEEAEEEAAV